MSDLREMAKAAKVPEARWPYIYGSTADRTVATDNILRLLDRVDVLETALEKIVSNSDATLALNPLQQLSMDIARAALKG